MLAFSLTSYFSKYSTGVLTAEISSPLTVFLVHTSSVDAKLL